MHSAAWQDDADKACRILDQERADLLKLSPEEMIPDIRDHLRKNRVNSYNKAINDPRVFHDPEVINSPKIISRPGLEDLELKPRVPYVEPPPIYVVTKAVRNRNHPEILEVEEGDLVLKKFNPLGGFARWTYEEDEYTMRDKFPHISDKCYEMMRNNLFIYVRKLGATAKTGVNNTAFEEVGSQPILMEDSQAGFVPLKNLQSVADSKFPPKRSECVLLERCAARTRTCLP